MQSKTKTDKYSSFVFRPRPDITADFPQAYFSDEEVERCKAAIKFALQKLGPEELKAVIKGFEIGGINGAVRTKDIVSCVVAANNGLYTYDEIQSRMFPYLNSKNEEQARHSKKQLWNFQYWFLQIICSPSKKSFHAFCTPENCFFTSTTIDLCKEMLGPESVETEILFEREPAIA